MKERGIRNKSYSKSTSIISNKLRAAAGLRDAAPALRRQQEGEK